MPKRPKTGISLSNLAGAVAPAGGRRGVSQLSSGGGQDGERT